MQLTEQDRRLIRQVVHEGLNDFVKNAVSTVTNAGRQGVDAVRNSYRSSNGKPGFFSGTFNAAANALTDGSYGKLRQMYQQNQVQNARKNRFNGGQYGEYVQKYFDYWAQNVKGSFHIDSNQDRLDNDTAAGRAVNMWNSWYAEQTGLDNVKDYDLDAYIMNEIGSNKEAKDLSYQGFLKYKQKLDKQRNSSAIQDEVPDNN